jgi:hypothetical protein
MEDMAFDRSEPTSVIYPKIFFNHTGQTIIILCKGFIKNSRGKSSRASELVELVVMGDLSI